MSRHDSTYDDVVEDLRLVRLPNYEVRMPKKMAIVLEAALVCGTLVSLDFYVVKTESLGADRPTIVTLCPTGAPRVSKTRREKSRARSHTGERG